MLQRRIFALLCAVAFAAVVTGCAPMSDEDRTAQEAGGTVPWNKPQSWEGGGALGSQMQQFNH
ncbi:MAG: hypothetical protein BGO12_16495 [Verrucomicrobia bacterium 61-8]|nr:hypothetical protein [Verrucomicrobiota bacterium]OJV21728.1 MAG: hypothetical protein BGO12_16495 [Verrucomicrobia bacterium 61-8]